MLEVLFVRAPRFFNTDVLRIMPFAAAKDDSQGGNGACKVALKMGDMVEDEDELLEINLEMAGDVSVLIPPCWENCIAATRSVLLANCILPINVVLNAIPIEFTSLEHHTDHHQSYGLLMIQDEGFSAKQLKHP
ncbi:hypothetical protein Droror1_Dr00013815 [Drosera rotundifolia]